MNKLNFEKILFTIAIPAYKEEFLERCIASILNQTFTDFEIIILNDNSPSDLNKIVHGFHDRRIKYYQNEINIGALNVVDNWNKCLRFAKGKYFVLIGDDDMLENNYLEEFQKHIALFPDYNLYHCRSRIIDEQDNTIRIATALPLKESCIEFMWHRLRGLRTQFIGDFVFNTNALKKNNGFYKFPLAWYTDDLTTIIMANPKGIIHINKLLFLYRSHEKSITLTGSIREKIKADQLYFKKLKEFLLKFKDLDALDSFLLKEINQNLHLYQRRKKIEIFTTNKFDVRIFLKLILDEKKILDSIYIGIKIIYTTFKRHLKLR